jgi:hypothetical protein
MSEEIAEHKAAVAVLLLLLVGGALFLFVLPAYSCSSTSCQPVGGGDGTAVTTTTSLAAPSGTAYIDAWANYTGGSIHFSKTSPLTFTPASTVSIDGHTITAITVRLKLDIQNAQPTSYGGSVLVYTCGACGDQQVAVGNFPVTKAISKASFSVSSFPNLKATDNLTLLIYPAAVQVTVPSGSFVLAMSPVAISNAKVASTTTKAHLACPSSLPMYDFNLQQVGTATLVSYAKAVGVWGGTTDSDVGLLATYYLGSYTNQNVLVSNLGGPSGSHYGLLSGYHYNADGSCSS